jgi:hypothetical protein
MGRLKRKIINELSSMMQVLVSVFLGRPQTPAPPTDPATDPEPTPRELATKLLASPRNMTDKEKRDANARYLRARRSRLCLCFPGNLCVCSRSESDVCSSLPTLSLSLSLSLSRTNGLCLCVSARENRQPRAPALSAEGPRAVHETKHAACCRVAAAVHPCFVCLLPVSAPVGHAVVPGSKVSELRRPVGER